MSVREALHWLADALNEPASRLQPDTHRSALAGWDSLGQLVLMSALDQDFNIRLTQKELASLASVQDVLNVLDKHGRLSRP